MNTVWARTICRLLVALMIWTPYHFATAGMIGTDQVVDRRLRKPTAAPC